MKFNLDLGVKFGESVGEAGMGGKVRERVGESGESGMAGMRNLDFALYTRDEHIKECT